MDDEREDILEERSERRGERLKKGCGCGCLVVVIIFLLAVAAGVFAFFEIKADYEGEEQKGEEVVISIEQGSGTVTISEALGEAGLIKYPQVFRLYVGQVGYGSDLQYGDFAIPNGSSYDEIIQILIQTVAAETTRVTFPEGSTAISIANKMEEAGLCSAEEFLQVANEGDFSQFEFWASVPTEEEAPNRFMKCEGYLFPETYDFYNDDTVYNYVATFYAEFDKYVTPELLAELDAKEMTLQELVVLASIVQEEAGNEEDEKVAAIFLNRLADNSPLTLLQSNTSSYIQNPEDNNYVYNWIAPYYGGWDLIPENMRIAYDTYATQGLPPGPISNPGYEAILATMNPDPSMEGYYYFVTDLTGVYYYGRTLAEHNANVDKAWAVNDSL